MGDYISGIQQIGIGVINAKESLRYYSRLLGMNALVFDDTAEASLMSLYTGGKVYQRQAMLSLNMHGGGGLEIWQFKNRQPSLPRFAPQYGDLGIYAAKIKTPNVQLAFEQYQYRSDIELSSLQKDTNTYQQFYMLDNQQNIFNLVHGQEWFTKKEGRGGGVCGAVIGVSDMQKAIRFYSTLLNITEVAYDECIKTSCAFDINQNHYRKVILRKTACEKGAFSSLLGAVEIELVQCLDRTPQKIYKERFWGDCGFIHLCFDVFNMPALKEKLEAAGYPFTIDSNNTFEMQNAAGRFCYVEDPDGTLIELVETHKIPMYKKLGIYLNLVKRGVEKPLPHWMIKLLALSKVK